MDVVLHCHVVACSCSDRCRAGHLRSLADVGSLPCKWGNTRSLPTCLSRAAWPALPARHSEDLAALLEPAPRCLAPAVPLFARIPERKSRPGTMQSRGGSRGGGSGNDGVSRPLHMPMLVAVLDGTAEADMVYSALLDACHRVGVASEDVVRIGAEQFNFGPRDVREKLYVPPPRASVPLTRLLSRERHSVPFDPLLLPPSQSTLPPPPRG